MPSGKTLLHDNRSLAASNEQKQYERAGGARKLELEMARAVLQRPGARLFQIS